MQFKEPKNTDKYYWTEHVKFKMQYYGISAQRILGIISIPRRKEEGIVKNTIAVMKPVSPKKTDGKEIWKQEIWVMYQLKKTKSAITNLPVKQIRIISAWRYPGVSPERDPIPQEILEEIRNIL